MAQQNQKQQPQDPHSRAVSRSQHDRMESAAPIQRRAHVRKQFVLCFDGTGNKFSGTDADSNILKVYRMLDRNGDDQFHYYQPGIGTYVAQADSSMSRTGRIDRFKHWYAKAKDSAIGTSFDLHVMAGYRVSQQICSFQCSGHPQCSLVALIALSSANHRLTSPSVPDEVLHSRR
jgi:uncharacterized protein (DUF2235 family)